jgi:hypothetical protein
MEKPESIDHNKRATLLGAVALAGGALIPAAMGTYKKYTNFHREHTVESHEAETPQIEAYDNLSQSGYFFYEVALHAPTLERDIAIVQTRAELVAQIEREFTLPGIPSAVIQSTITKLMPALAFVESRLEPDAESDQKAFGLLQIMPKTWDELAKEGEEKSNISDQIKVAARLIEQTYRHITSTCADELATIKENFFAGDNDMFDECFMCPVLMNAYNAGMGTLSSLIQKFVADYPTPASTVELFEQSEMLTGFDVFIGMSHTAYHQEWVEWYKEHATDYTTKIYCAELVLGAYRKDKLPT